MPLTLRPQTVSTARQAANEIEYQPETERPKPGENAGAPRNVSIKIDTKTNMLGVFDAEKLIAAYPVTVRSQQHRFTHR